MVRSDDSNLIRSCIFIDMRSDGWREQTRPLAGNFPKLAGTDFWREKKFGGYRTAHAVLVGALPRTPRGGAAPSTPARSFGSGAPSRGAAPGTPQGGAAPLTLQHASQRLISSVRACTPHSPNPFIKRNQTLIAIQQIQLTKKIVR